MKIDRTLKNSPTMTEKCKGMALMKTTVWIG